MQSSPSTSPPAVVQQVWNEINNDSNNASVEDSSKSLVNHLQTGWTSDEALVMREKSGDDGTFNVVKPPIDCPAWLCIMLPCIKNFPSMKAFKSVCPDDAEVCRSGQWIRYDAASLVLGDVIQLEEGDLVPADCVVVAVDDGDVALLVDLKAVTGLERPKSVSNDANSRGQRQLFMGGTVVQGRATALVTSIGPYSLLGKLIREGRFPPKEAVLEATVVDGNAAGTGVELGSMS